MDLKEKVRKLKFFLEDNKNLPFKAAGITGYYGTYMALYGLMINIATYSIIGDNLAATNIAGYGIVFYMVKDELPTFVNDLAEGVRR